MKKLYFLSLSLIISIILISQGNTESNEAIILLNKMTNASRNLTYDGKIIYIKNNQASSLSIKHFFDELGRKEIITPLDHQGNPLELKFKDFSLTQNPKIRSLMSQVYSFDIGSMGKVAGRPCYTVLARPKDRKRYLKKFCIDQKYYLLLQYTLINQKHKIIEQFMFTDLSIDSSVDNTIKIKSLVATTDKWQNKPITDQLSDDSQWIFNKLPSGFRVIQREKSTQLDQKEQIIISDGLSTISVFIANKKIKPLNSNIIFYETSGALNILSKQLDQYLITIVGDAPQQTLKEIFNSIKTQKKQ